MMIVPLILQRYKTALTTALITNVTGPTQAKLVKIGRFQDDPTIKSIYVAISGGDPDNIEYRDGIVSLEEMQRIGFAAYPREIGGGQMWWRRGVIQVGCYFVVERVNEETAAQYAYDVLGRIENAIEGTTVIDLVDDFNERAIMGFCFSNSFFESGGPPQDYIWRGKVLWSVLTERRPPQFSF